MTRIRNARARDDGVTCGIERHPQYLASKKPESGLWPTEPRRQADVSRWQFWQTAHWGPTCGTFVFERVVKRLANLGPANEPEVTKAEPDFHKYAQVLNRQLGERTWLTGDTLTVADLSVGAWMVYGSQAGFRWTISRDHPLVPRPRGCRRGRGVPRHRRDSFGPPSKRRHRYVSSGTEGWFGVHG